MDAGRVDSDAVLSCEKGITAIEYLLVAALLVIVFAALRFTLLNTLMGLYKFFIEMICAPVL